MRTWTYGGMTLTREVVAGPITIVDENQEEFGTASTIRSATDMIREYRITEDRG